jgi:hypothetical protein
MTARIGTPSLRSLYGKNEFVGCVCAPEFRLKTKLCWTSRVEFTPNKIGNA